MKKRKTTTVVVLALELMAITVLHAVKISHTEKSVNAQAMKSAYQADNQQGSKSGSIFSLAVFK